MTALSQYQRLESTGLWRSDPEAQRREVVVAFRDTSLVISDTRSQTPLSHWSLPAVLRINPGEIPAIYAPGTDPGETLELDDDTLIAAIEKVHRLIEARRPHPGRLRVMLLGVALAMVIGFAVFWLPGELVRHTVAVVPMAQRDAIGRMVVADLARVTGAPCDQGSGPRSLDRLAARLFAAGGGQIVVLPGVVGGAIHAPGRIVVLGRDLVEDHEAPEVAAGYILAEGLRAEAVNPLEDLLRWAGLRATFRLLTTGLLPQEVVEGYGEFLLTRDTKSILDTALIASFAAAGVPSTPYAYAVDPSGEGVLGLIEGDPYRAATPPAPVLEPADWLALQGICAT